MTTTQIKKLKALEKRKLEWTMIWIVLGVMATMLVVRVIILIVKVKDLPYSLPSQIGCL